MKQVTLAMILFLSLAAKASSTKKVMHQALDSVVHLLPFISNEFAFKDPKHEKEINNHLTKILVSFKEAEHLKDFQMPGFAPSYEILKDHLEDTILSFNSNKRTFARIKLANTTSLCISCHAQLPKDNISTYILDNNKVNKKKFVSSYDYANFLMLLRRYEQSVQMFKSSISERFAKQIEMNQIQNLLGNDIEQFDRTLYHSFLGILTIYAKILKKPEEAIQLFNKYIKDKRTPRYMKRDLSKWQRGLRKWVEIEKISSVIKDDQKMKQFLNTHVSNLESEGETIASGFYDVDLLVISGVLGNFLNTRPNTTLAPDILYWLGISENRLNKNIFFTLGDLYLKQCITKYPKSDYAIKCYLEYESELTFRYTGSVGTNLPKSKIRELQNLKALIK